LGEACRLTPIIVTRGPRAEWRILRIDLIRTTTLTTKYLRLQAGIGSVRIGRWSDVKIVESIVFSSFLQPPQAKFGPNAAMLVPHRLWVVPDGPSLFHEREGLSMLKSLR